MQKHCLILVVAFLWLALASCNTPHYHIYTRTHSLTLLITDYTHHCLFVYRLKVTSVNKYIFVIPYLHVSLFVTGFKPVRDTYEM